MNWEQGILLSETAPTLAVPPSTTPLAMEHRRARVCTGGIYLREKEAHTEGREKPPFMGRSGDPCMGDHDDPFMGHLTDP